MGYVVGRIGCQLSGDGDYGIESDLPWAMAYPDGTVPTTDEVHPTPIYDTLTMGIGALVLWHLRDRFPEGVVFGLYLILTGGQRFLVELIRRNDSVVAGLTQPQLISLVLLALGVAIVLVRRNAPRPRARLARGHRHPAARRHRARGPPTLPWRCPRGRRARARRSRRPPPPAQHRPWPARGDGAWRRTATGGPPARRARAGRRGPARRRRSRWPAARASARRTSADGAPAPRHPRRRTTEPRAAGGESPGGGRRRRRARRRPRDRPSITPRGSPNSSSVRRWGESGASASSAPRPTSPVTATAVPVSAPMRGSRAASAITSAATSAPPAAPTRASCRPAPRARVRAAARAASDSAG